MPSKPRNFFDYFFLNWSELGRTVLIGIFAYLILILFARVGQTHINQTQRLAVARANPRTAVVLYCGSPIDMTDWVNDVPTILLLWYPGSENGNALAAVLSGDVSPSGRLPISFPKRY